MLPSSHRTRAGFLALLVGFALLIPVTTPAQGQAGGSPPCPSCSTDEQTILDKAMDIIALVNPAAASGLTGITIQVVTNLNGGKDEAEWDSATNTIFVDASVFTHDPEGHFLASILVHEWGHVPQPDVFDDPSTYEDDIQEKKDELEALRGEIDFLDDLIAYYEMQLLIALSNGDILAAEYYQSVIEKLREYKKDAIDLWGETLLELLELLLKALAPYHPLPLKHGPSSSSLPGGLVITGPAAGSMTGAGTAGTTDAHN